MVDVYNKIENVKAWLYKKHVYVNLFPPAESEKANNVVTRRFISLPNKLHVFIDILQIFLSNSKSRFMRKSYHEKTLYANKDTLYFESLTYFHGIDRCAVISIVNSAV